MDETPIEQGAQIPFYARPTADVLSHLESHLTGLASKEAQLRLDRYGANVLPAPAPRHPLLRFLDQFNNVLIYFLLASAAVAATMGHAVDAAVIAIVVVVNAIVGFLQEGKAESALAAIRGMVSPTAHALRDGLRVAVAVADLVPGDVVLLDAGDRVPADLRLLRARGLLIDEAALTGESVAAEKSEDPVAADALLGDRSSMAFCGTLIAAGHAAGIVTATGSSTEIGRISTLIGGVEEVTTPLLRQINTFGRRFTWATFAGAVVLLLFAVLMRGYAWGDAMMAVVALSVGAIPEGLPAVITITLAIGVQRMAARNAAIRRLPAVETLGATSVICSDKTGTLTRNEMTARRVVVAGGTVSVGGAGYAPKGELAFEDGAARSDIEALARAGLLCNDARLIEKGGAWASIGDPMEGALVALAIKSGLDADDVRRKWKRLDEIPFDAQHRTMATLNAGPHDERCIFVKGAPERVIGLCACEIKDGKPTTIDHAFWTEHIAAAAAAGERVLGFAMKRAMPDTSDITLQDLDQDLVLLGIVGFLDPPREDAVQAIAACRAAGIAVKMITGDHAATAVSIARQLGLGEEPRALTGHEIDSLSDEELSREIGSISVFARTSPEHKLRIVRALQADGQIVAMTGDGVNDAPSLKQADVGIAMGHKGTEAAKEAAQIVLLDDNFSSIVAAVHEGRTVYDNIRKVTAWTLPTNGGEGFTIIAAIVFGFTMPMTPAQILWINMITTITLGLVLAFEPAEAHVMRRPPRPPQAGLLNAFLVWRVVFVSLVFVAGALGIFFYALGQGYDLEMARTMVVNTIVVFEIAYLFNVRYLHTTSLTWQGALGTRPVLIAITGATAAQLAFTYLPPMQHLFETRPVAVLDGVLILAAGALAMIVFETEKLLMRRLGVLELNT